MLRFSNRDPKLIDLEAPMPTEEDQSVEADLHLGLGLESLYQRYLAYLRLQQGANYLPF